MGEMQPWTGSRFGLVGSLVWGALLAGAAWALRFVGDVERGRVLVLPLWAVLAPVLVAGLVWALMRVRGFPPGGPSLRFGAPLLALAAAAGLPGLLTAAPVPPPGAPADPARTVVGPVVPVGIDGVVVPPGPGLGRLTVQFATVETLDGRWAHHGAGISGPGITSDAPDRAPDWSMVIWSRGGASSRGVTPSFDVSFPVDTVPPGTTVPVVATTTLQYPVAAGGDRSSFQEREQVLTRRLQVYVASPQDRDFVAGLAAWRADRVAVERYPIGLAVVGGLGLVASVGGLLSFAAARGRGAPR